MSTALKIRPFDVQALYDLAAEHRVFSAQILHALRDGPPKANVFQRTAELLEDAAQAIEHEREIAVAYADLRMSAVEFVKDWEKHDYELPELAAINALQLRSSLQKVLP